MVIVFRYKSASANLAHLVNTTWILVCVRSEIRGQGHASTLMQNIVDHADAEGKFIQLVVQAYGPGRDILTNKQLVQFYKKFGFQVDGSLRPPIHMIRYCSQDLHTP